MNLEEYGTLVNWDLTRDIRPTNIQVISVSNINKKRINFEGIRRYFHCDNFITAVDFKTMHHKVDYKNRLEFKKK